MSEPAEWHIVTVTEGGTVSILKNLTEAVARQTMQRLRRPFDRGDPWGDAAIAERVDHEAGVNNQPRGWSYTVSPGQLKDIHCFGPEGETLDVWPKPADYDERYEAALAKAQAARARGKASPQST